MEWRTRREETQKGRERDGQMSGGKDGGGCEGRGYPGEKEWRFRDLEKQLRSAFALVLGWMFLLPSNVSISCC